MECTNGLTKAFTKVIGKTIRSLAMETIPGMTAGPIRGTGSTITCMAMESTNGPMAESTKGNTSTIKNMAMVLTSIQMVDLIADNGLLASSTVKEFLSPHREPTGKEFGKKERESIGLRSKMPIKITTCNNTEDKALVIIILM